MIINRITRIRNHNIFKDFVWSGTLPEFKRYNLIYGWNGSGKTTLANILRCIEKRKDISPGEFSVDIDGKIIASTSFASEQSMPKVRVFNREFVEENIFTVSREVSPIFYLGKKSIDKQKELETLKGKLLEKVKERERLNNLKLRAGTEAEQFNIDKAKEIKELLSSGGSNQYNHYNKTMFRNKAEEFSRVANCDTRILGNEQKEAYKKQKDASPKPELPSLTLGSVDLKSITSKVNEVLDRAVSSNIIETLRKDKELSNWIEAGLIIHEAGSKGLCLFCNRTLPPDLLRKYRDHFNDQFTLLMSDIESLLYMIHAAGTALSIEFPSKAELYDHLCSKYQATCKEAKIGIGKIWQSLNDLERKLQDRKNSPFEIIQSVSMPDVEEPLAAVNLIIAEHNTETKAFKQTVASARSKLEDCYVCEALNSFKQHKTKVAKLEIQEQPLVNDIAALQRQIADDERQIIEFRTPADELNAELASYLGHADLKFEILGNGYRIMRNGIQAEGLSEGEKTAVAFLYFLKTLSDKSFKIKEGIIVIDDPVSSLDANSLFSSFGFMQTKVKDAGQLIILTHNFPLFKQVKRWYSYSFRKYSEFFMVEASYVGDCRISNLLPLDRLLSEYDSEYHYLFKQVFDCASNSTSQTLESYYHMPNLARRLLESFLSFKHPKKANEGLTDLLRETPFDDAKKSKMVRFLHTHSHSESIDDPEHDISILSETPEILRDVLKLIADLDKQHYDELAEMVKPKQDAEEGIPATM